MTATAVIASPFQSFRILPACRPDSTGMQQCTIAARRRMQCTAVACDDANTYYTLSHKKTRHPTHVDNFAKY